MFGKKSLGEIHQLHDDAVAGIGPITGELEAVTGLIVSPPCTASDLMNVLHAGGVGIIAGVRAVRDNKDLNVFIQARAGPKAVTLITVNLVESLAEGHSAPLEFDMHHRQAVHQDGHVIAAFIGPFRFFILVEHLQAVIMDGLFIYQADVFAAAVIPPEHLDVICLDFAGFFNNTFIGAGNVLIKEALPLGIRKSDLVEQLELLSQVGNQGSFIAYRDIFVPLRLKTLQQVGFHRCFALVIHRTVRLGGVFCHHGGFFAAGNDVIKTHGCFSLKVSSLSR